MKNILEILVDKTVNNLLQICRTYGLSGYSRLRKDGLINLINQNINNPQFEEKIQDLIPQNGTVAFIFKALTQNSNEMEYSVLREEVLKNRSNSSFRSYFQILLTNFIIFESENSEEDTIILPKEYTENAKKVIDERLEEEEIDDVEDELDEKREKKEIETIDDLLYSKKYTTVQSLSNLLNRLGEETSGNKSELITHLLYETEISTEDLINSMFSKVDLKEICRDFDLYVSGTKEDLVTRILQKLPLEKPIKAHKKQSKKATKKETVSKAEMMASGAVKSKSNIQEQKRTSSENIDLIKDIHDYLNNIHLDVHSISNQDSLQGQIFSLIKNLKYIKPEYKNVQIKRDSSEPVILMQNNDDKLAIAVHYFDKKKGITKQRRIISDNIMNFKIRKSKNLLYYIYDPNQRLSNDDVEMFEQIIKLIYKTERQFLE